MYDVIAYLLTNEKHCFTGRDVNHARQIAKRIVMEGLHVCDDGVEEFYPTDKIFKVKILPA
jgi:hypothetical protein